MGTASSYRSFLLIAGIGSNASYLGVGFLNTGNNGVSLTDVVNNTGRTISASFDNGALTFSITGGYMYGGVRMIFLS